MTAFVGSVLSGVVIGLTGSSLGKVIFGLIVVDKHGKKIGLTERYDRSLWDYLVVGLQFPRRELEVALHTNEGKDA